MDKAIFINGGAGRVLAAIPVLEKYVEKNPECKLGDDECLSCGS